MTPEIIAEYTAKLARNCSVIDGFCGSGGNVIQFSKYCSEVFAIDIDHKRLEICKNNCKIYNCKNNIHFIEYDFLKIQIIIFRKFKNNLLKIQISMLIFKRTNINILKLF